MKKNPIIPYILIMAFGIGLIFFMSLDGADKKEEIAKGDETKTEESAKGEEAAGEFDPEAFAASKCISCHGENLEGSMDQTYTVQVYQLMRLKIFFKMVKAACLVV